MSQADDLLELIQVSVRPCATGDLCGAGEVCVPERRENQKPGFQVLIDLESISSISIKVLQ